MRLIPIFEENAAKGAGVATFFQILGVIGLLVSVITFNITGIISSVLLMAVGSVINDLRSIMWHTKGYYIIDDEQKQQTQEWDENTGNQYQNFV